MRVPPKMEQETENIENLISEIKKMSIWEFALLFQQLQLKNLGPFKSLHKFKAHQGIVRRIIFCTLGPKSKQRLFLISCGVDKLIKIWDIATYSLLQTLDGHHGSVYKLMTIKQNNKKYLVSSSSDKTIKIWSLNTFKVVRTLSGHTNTPYAMIFIKKKKMLVTGDWDGNLIFWNMSLGTIILSYRTHMSEIYSLHYDENVDSLIVGFRSSDKLWFFDMKKKGFCSDFELPGFTNENFVKFIFEISEIKIQNELNDFLVCSGSNNVALVNKDYKLKQFSLLKGHTNQVRSFAYCNKKKILITVSCDRRVCVWKMDFDKEKNKLFIREDENLESQHSDNINCVAIDEEENYLATCSWDGDILLYNLN